MAAGRIPTSTRRASWALSGWVISSRLPPVLLTTPTGAQTLAQLNGLVTQQAAMVAYLDDFKTMFMITLCALPLLLLRQKKAGTPSVGPARQAEEQVAGSAEVMVE